VSWHDWIVRFRAEGAAVGFVQATVTDVTADVAWLIGVLLQRQGIAVEAASAVCGWHSTQGVRRLTAHIHPDHVASAKVARELGMVATGVLDPDGEQIWSGQLSPPGTPG
jgi:RimJ/RimL family protein N-acetyltransferase